MNNSILSVTNISHLQLNNVTLREHDANTLSNFYVKKKKKKQFIFWFQIKNKYSMF